MLRALAPELRETARIARHFLPLGHALRASAELAVVAGLIGVVSLVAVASTTPAPRGAVMIAEASR